MKRQKPLFALHKRLLMRRRRFCAFHQAVLRYTHIPSARASQVGLSGISSQAVEINTSPPALEAAVPSAPSAKVLAHLAKLGTELRQLDPSLPIAFPPRPPGTLQAAASQDSGDDVGSCSDGGQGDAGLSLAAMGKPLGAAEATAALQRLQNLQADAAAALGPPRPSAPRQTDDAGAFQWIIQVEQAVGSVTAIIASIVLA